jgi:hypothetical protein
MNQHSRPLSLHPLKFDEVMTDILKIKPEPKPPKPENRKTEPHQRPKLKRKAKST